MLAVIVGIGSTLFSQFTAGFGGDQPTIDDAMAIVLAALSLLGLGIFGPGIANGIVSGGPQLGAGAAVGTGLAAGGVVAAGAGLAAGGAGLAGGAARRRCSRRGSDRRRRRAPLIARRRVRSCELGVSKAPRRSSVRCGVPPRASSQLRSRRPGRDGRSGASAAECADARPPPDRRRRQPPAWAQRMKRSQTVSHGASAATHAVRSGDSGGGGASVDLSEGE